MSSTKALLKGAAEAVKQQRYDDAITQANNIITTESRNYPARILLAFALDKKGNPAEAEQTYDEAAKLKPGDAQAWQGLIKLYEKQGDVKIPAYQNAAFHLAQIFAQAEDMYKCQDTVDKFIDFARTRGTKRQYVDALGVILPGSALYPILEGRIWHPAKTFETIAQILEVEEKKQINTLIGERRTRIGARVELVTIEVKREVLGKSSLGHVYRELINWTNDDDMRRQTEEKLLQFHYDRLLVFPAGEDKTNELGIVQQLADGMVIVKHPFRLAWEIAIDWKDYRETKEWDVGILRQYCAFFRGSDLFKVITGYLSSTMSPFPTIPPTLNDNTPAQDAVSNSDEDDEGGGADTVVEPVNDEDRLLMMTEGITTARSLFAYRLMAEYYQSIQEHESTVELMRKALNYLRVEQTKSGLSFQNTKDNFSLHLGTALVYYQSPRHHQEAKALFDSILERVPTSTEALIGVGMIYEEEEDFAHAIDFLDRAYKRDPENLRVRVEAAWVKALDGDVVHSQPDLEKCAAAMLEKGSIFRDQLAQTRWRIGYCVWQSDDSKAARKSRADGSAYQWFLDALKTDVNFAPAYTSLGIFYADYARDKKRARKCFQKAVELSTSEVLSAERLARSFADDADWDKVELVAQRVVDSGKVKPPPGSKRQGIAWPFAALGVAELHKQEFHKAIVSFQAALRLSPEDYNCWVGLGESYYSSGRFVAATKAIQHAVQLDEARGTDKSPEAWFTAFILANIRRELGEYDEAISTYEIVMKEKPDEEGVAVAMMQTLVDNAMDSVEKGLFGKAIELAKRTLEFATGVPHKVTKTFNYWKAVADACSVFSRLQSRLTDFPISAVQQLLGQENDVPEYTIFKDVDKVDLGIISTNAVFADDEQVGVDLTRALHAVILAHKRAVHLSAHDLHSQSVAYYNLGWAEYQAHLALPLDLKSQSSRYARAALGCFKRAIELEAGNAEFWNALGVVTSQISPAVAQHAFVRSLHLDERSAQVWTNLGTLALLQNDVQMANESFTRAQSTDPEYAHAWLGQGLIALLLGDTKEARGLFTHAMEISEASSAITRQQYSQAMFDYILTNPPNLSMTSLLLPILGLTHLRGMEPRTLAYSHLSAQFQERIHDNDKPVTTLSDICTTLEADFEATESAEALKHFALAKTDLARALLATGQYAEAIECGEMALQLSSDESDNELSVDERRKARLSAHLTCGLAQYYNNNIAEALTYFEAALAESQGNPDAVCVLAQVLWASGSVESKSRARELLFEVVEKRPDHVQSVLLLGVIALLDGDEESLEAVVAELRGLRVGEKVTVSQRAQISDVLQAIVTASTSTSTTTTNSSGNVADSQGALAEAQMDIMINPQLPHGWSSLAEEVSTSPNNGDDDDAYVKEMALKLALGAVPPKGDIGAEDLATVYAGLGTAAAAQIGVVVAPWNGCGWEALADAVEG